MEDTSEVVEVEGNSNDLSPEQVAKFEAKQKELWLQMLGQFMDSERFVDFIENNYLIQDIIDDENKTVTRRVMEKPTVVGPRLSPTQMKDIYLACSSAGVLDTVKLVGKLLIILGQEAPSIILPGDSSRPDRELL